MNMSFGKLLFLVTGYALVQSGINPSETSIGVASMMVGASLIFVPVGLLLASLRR